MFRFKWLAIGFLVIGGSAAPADELRLSGGADRLTGRVLSIDRDGVVELASELSAEPIRLRRDAVEMVRFNEHADGDPDADARVELRNGDLLPVVVKDLDEKSLTVESRESGRLTIPRDAVRYLQMGVRANEVVYSGPKSLDEWVMEGPERERWDFRRGSLLAEGETRASKDLSLPVKFVLRFTLEWEEKQVPGFELFFADPLSEPGDPTDRYRLRFGGAGLDVIREASVGKRYNKLLVLNRTPNRYPDHTLRVEIQVDRRAGKLWLFLNGELEGEFVDPIPSVPGGSGVTLVCNTPNDGTQEIHDFQVLRLADDAHRRHRAEERGDLGQDHLFSRDDDRWGGRLLGMAEREDGRVFRFMSDFQDSPMEVPESEVATLFFAESGEGGDGPADDGEDAGPAGGGGWVLRLQGGGVLQVERCEFGETEVFAEHPLLGELRFGRDGVAMLEREMTDSTEEDEK